MLFNSFEFIFAFLPLTLVGYFAFARYWGIESALGFLTIASLFFYSWWNPAYLPLIGFSVVFNYFVGSRLSRAGTGKALLIVGITANLGLLGYYKYANFFVDNVNLLTGSEWNLQHIILPLAISFFTFQQISYLVDAWQGKTKEYNFLHYTLFVCFFPQLIAGPIVHHREMLPQFMSGNSLSPQWRNFAIGISIFAIGLFKKTIIADSLSAYVSPVYDNPEAAGQLEFFTAWGSTLAYTFQLYFDFSGYSDMAIGCARMFGIRLPVNFFSPYKSRNIIEFWRRWHITLSRFLRDYLYIALGGNRKGPSRRYINLFLTMLLGGLWHGAGWPFVIWGMLHGSYLMINHGWRWLRKKLGLEFGDGGLYGALCWLTTFLAVVVSWVYFRAPTLEHANSIVAAMAGANGASLPSGLIARANQLFEWFSVLPFSANQGSGSALVSNYLLVVFAALAALLLPNVAQIFHRESPVLFERETSFQGQRQALFLVWRPTKLWVVAIASCLLLGCLSLSQVSEFLYFQF